MFYNQAFPQYSINRCLTILVRASFIRTYTCLQQQAAAAAAVLGVLAPAPTPVVATQLQQQQLPTVLAPVPAHVTPTVNASTAASAVAARSCRRPTRRMTSPSRLVGSSCPDLAVTSPGAACARSTSSDLPNFPFLFRFCSCSSSSCPRSPPFVPLFIYLSIHSFTHSFIFPLSIYSSYFLPNDEFFVVVVVITT